MNEVGYLNINASNREVERNPNIVRLCSDVGILEYVRPKTGHWSHDGSHWENRFICSECGYKLFDEPTNYCSNCGCRMVESKESEE